MNRYTLYCTADQTKKALELGAPIKQTPKDGFLHTPSTFVRTDVWYINPTAEEMIGWLEEQGIYINFDTTSEEDENHNLIITWEYFIYNHYHDNINEEFIRYPTYKKATLAAIDAALEYLINKK